MVKSLFNDVYLYSSYLICTKEEIIDENKEYVDKVISFKDLKLKSPLEKEAYMSFLAIKNLLLKNHLKESDISLAFGGDLSNQIFVSNYAIKNFKIPYFGIYSACSTLIEALILSSLSINENSIYNLGFISSSYNVSEDQFRNPLELGIQKKETVTITKNGALSFLVCKNKTKIKLHSYVIGRCIDSLSNNVLDMGKIMAISCFEVLIKHLKNRKAVISDYDLILTGDLGRRGLDILKKMLAYDGYDNLDKIKDASSMLEKKFQGGSGPMCLALIAFSFVKNKLEKKEYKKVILIGTGSLHSKSSSLYKLNVPTISHLVELRSL